MFWQVAEGELSVVAGHPSSSGLLLEVGGVLPVLHGGEMQSSSTTIPATPAASGSTCCFTLFYLLFKTCECNTAKVRFLEDMIIVQSTVFLI